MVWVSLRQPKIPGADSPTGGMKPIGGGGIGTIGTIGTTNPLPIFQCTDPRSESFYSAKSNEATNLPFVVAGGRAVIIGKAVGSGRGPDV